MLYVNQPILAERVNARRADECAKFQLAFRGANFVIDFNVALSINLVSIDAEFGFDVDWHLYFQQCERIPHRAQISELFQRLSHRRCRQLFLRLFADPKHLL